MKLREIQKRMFASVLEPLTPGDRMRIRALDGRSLREEAKTLIKSNGGLSSFARLEIYNQQYWFRVTASLADDFPGLRAILGERRFQKLTLSYLQDCPSRSFTLRDLGSRLPQWLAANPRAAGRRIKLALDMARLEWAHIETFDAADESPLTLEDLRDLDPSIPDFRLPLIPALHLLELSYPVDEIRIAVQSGTNWNPPASNAARKISSSSTPLSFAGIRPAPVYVAVHRSDHTVYYKRLTPEACRALAALKKGATLMRAISRAFRGSVIPPESRPEKVRAWFEEWSGLGWFSRASARG